MSSVLFASPSFLCGIARTLDLGAQLDSYNSGATPEQSNRLALFSDWLAVADDLWLALDEYQREHPELEPTPETKSVNHRQEYIGV